MPSLAAQLTAFYKHLDIGVPLPAGVEVLHPQRNKPVMQVTKAFFNKYYNDNKKRRLVIGINPGRFGAGITGINFTGPRQLREHCGIDHPFGDSSELSSEFIYEVVAAYGGASKFYSDFFITAVSPLGFVQDGKNLNYYDNQSLKDAITPFINDCLAQQLSFGFDRESCICIGGEKNFKYLSSLNDQRKSLDQPHFREIIPLPHPRFIMQYRRKQKQKFIELYIEQLH
jgi:hypothetical protein